MRFIGIFNYTVILTYLSLVSSIVGMAHAAKSNFVVAIICLLFSCLCDMFDGAVARTKKNRTKREKEFGIQIDSLVDIVAFGVAPAVILYFLGVNSIGGIAILVFFVLCGLIRLAFFNVLESERQSNLNASDCPKEYRGLPITSFAIILPLVCLLALLIPDFIDPWLYHIAPVVMGFLFILDFKVPKLNVEKLFSRKKNKKS